MFRVLALVLTVLPLQAAAQTSLSEGTGRLELQAAGRDSYAVVQFADGTVAERFTVRAGDCIRSINDCRDDRERVEFSGARSPIPQDREVWLSWDLLIPPEFPTVEPNATNNYLMGQVHQLGNSGPELKLHLFDDGLFLVMADPNRLDDDPMNPIPSFREIRLAPPNGVRGTWHEVRVQAIWSRGPNGLLNVWFNGRNVLSYAGPTSNASDDMFFKYGIYRTNVSRCGGPCPDATVYYRSVRQGPTEASVR